MLKLEAMLVAKAVARARRPGWSQERGIDFIVWPPAHRDAPVTTDRGLAGEPVSFLDDDRLRLPEAAVMHSYSSLAGRCAAPPGCTEPPLTRAWLSVARKGPGS